MLNDVQKHILQIVADMAGENAPGAVNIRSDGQKALSCFSTLATSLTS